MKKCNECGTWLDQPAPDGEQICDNCWAAKQIKHLPVSTRSRTVYQAQERQFKARLATWELLLQQNKENVFQTIHDWEKYKAREKTLIRLSDKALACSSDYMRGWMQGFRVMREDPFFLVFCPNWAFWHDEELINEKLQGEAAAYRAIHKS